VVGILHSPRRKRIVGGVGCRDLPETTSLKHIEKCPAGQIINPAIKNADYTLKILENFALLRQYVSAFRFRMNSQSRHSQ
jgi:hypothetical protein